MRTSDVEATLLLSAELVQGLLELSDPEALVDLAVVECLWDQETVLEEI